MSFPRHATQWTFFTKDVWKLFAQVFFTSACVLAFFSKGFSWATFFQRFLLGYLFFHRFLLGHLFPKVSCGAPFFQRLFWSNLFSKGLLFGLSTGCLGSNAASFVCQLLQFFHCVLYLLHFVASFLKHSF